MQVQVHTKYIHQFEDQFTIAICTIFNLLFIYISFVEAYDMPNAVPGAKESTVIKIRFLPLRSSQPNRGHIVQRNKDCI